MPRCVAFLRGINLGGRRPPMTRLKALFEELGFTEVATFIASGNVIFFTRAKSLQVLEGRIEKHLAQSLGYEVETFLRTADEVMGIGNATVFPEDGETGTAIHAVFLKNALPAREARKLEAIRTQHDEFRVVGREYYWLCRVRTSESGVWKHPGFQTLQLPTGTMRNLTSIRKLIAKHLVP